MNVTLQLMTRNKDIQFKAFFFTRQHDNRRQQSLKLPHLCLIHIYCSGNKRQELLCSRIWRLTTDDSEHDQLTRATLWDFSQTKIFANRFCFLCIWRNKTWETIINRQFNATMNNVKGGVTFIIFVKKKNKYI